MTVKDRVIEWLGAVSLTDLEARTGRAYEAGFYDGNDDPASGDFKAGGMGYKRLSDNYIREGKIDFRRALETAWSLWQKSPIAKRVLAMKRDHIIGRNAMPKTNDEKLKPILEAFWEQNKLKSRSSEFTIQLFGFGEQCFPAFVRESDGRVLIGYIDPANITEVKKHPDNALEDWAIIVERDAEKRVYRIIREDEDYVDDSEATESKNGGKLVMWEQATLQPWEEKLLKDCGRDEYDGSCFYAKVNAVSNQSRGMSDLLQVGDWLDQADEVLFALGDREGFAGYFSFDVTLKRANDARVKQRAKEIRANAPEKGSVNVHNENEEWQLHAPNLNQSGSIESFRAILGLILGGMGFPVHWYGFGDDANRATALAQADPTTRSLEHDQGIVKNLFLSMCRFVADQAEIAGSYTAGDDTEITLDLPEISSKDLGQLTTSINQLTVALISASDVGWLSQETAAIAFAKMMGEIGIEVNALDELGQIADDEEADELAYVASTNGQLQKMIADTPAVETPSPNGKATPENVMEKGLNGAQITSVLQVLDNLKGDLLPSTVATELLIAVGIQADRANRMVNDMVKMPAPDVSADGER